MKAENSWLIPRKHTENLELLTEMKSLSNILPFLAWLLVTHIPRIFKIQVAKCLQQLSRCFTNTYILGKKLELVLTAPVELVQCAPMVYRSWSGGVGLGEVQPFNDHRSQLIGSSLFCYNSLAAAAREVFKPSPDSASLVVSSQKKNFSFGLGVLLGGRHKWGCFHVFMAYFDRPWTPIEWAHIFDRIFL